MHLTIHRTGGAGAPGDVRADGNAPQAIPMRAYPMRAYGAPLVVRLPRQE